MEVKPWSYMKFPYLNRLGPQANSYRVGPLACVQNCDFIPSVLAEAQRRVICAYDPCLSCATYALGKMPLDVAPFVQSSANVTQR